MLNQRLRFFLISLLFLCFFVPKKLSAQASNLDSIWTVYKTQKDPINRLTALNGIAWSYLRIQPQKALEWAEYTLNYADSVDVHAQDAAAVNVIGIAYYLQGENNRALSELRRAYEMAIELKDTITMAATVNNQGLIFAQNGIYDKAHEYFKIGEEMARKRGNERDYCVSLKNIGTMLQKMGDYKKAINYLERSLKLAKKVGEPSSINAAYTQLGRIYVEMDSFDVALSYFEKALIGQRATEDNFGALNSLIDIGKIHSTKGNNITALVNFDEAINLAQLYNYNVGRRDALLSKAQLLASRGNQKAAIKAAEAIIKENSADYTPQTSEALLLLSKIHNQQGEYKKAYDYLFQHDFIEDSLYSADKAKIIEELEIKHEIDQIEQEKQQLIEQRKLDQTLLDNQKMILIGTIIILGLTVLLAFVYYRSYKQKQVNSEQLEVMVNERTAELKRANAVLERFAYISSHDLKEPLRNISGFTQLIGKRIAKKYPADATLAEYMSFIVRNTDQMDQLIDDLLTFTLASKQKFMPERVDPQEVMDKIKLALQTKINETEVEINFNTEVNEIITSRAAIFIIVKNLIENGIKYNLSKPPKVEIRFYRTDQKLFFSVRDNGIGIAKEYHEQIFGLFKRLHNRQDYVGSGLGLSIVKKILDQLQGSISVESDEGKGATFTVQLPIYNEEF